jgi:hypothetical protein
MKSMPMWRRKREVLAVAEFAGLVFVGMLDVTVKWSKTVQTA